MHLLQSDSHILEVTNSEQMGSGTLVLQTTADGRADGRAGGWTGGCTGLGHQNGHDQHTTTQQYRIDTTATTDHGTAIKHTKTSTPTTQQRTVVSCELGRWTLACTGRCGCAPCNLGRSRERDDITGRTCFELRIVNFELNLTLVGHWTLVRL